MLSVHIVFWSFFPFLTLPPLKDDVQSCLKFDYVKINIFLHLLVCHFSNYSMSNCCLMRSHLFRMLRSVLISISIVCAILFFAPLRFGRVCLHLAA